MWGLTPDLTAEVRRPTRWLAIILLGAATFLLLICDIIAVVIAVVGGKIAQAKLPLGGFVVLALLSLVCGWMLIRLCRGTRAPNGMTTMPEWFIRAFGIVMFAGLCIAAVTDGHPILLVEGFGVAIAMIGIGRLLRARREAESENQGVAPIDPND